MALGALLFAALVGLAKGLASTDTITWGGDNTRTGYQTNHNMDPAVVGSPAFGQLFKTALPGNYGGSPEQIFSQPLVYTPKSGTKQYVYVATTQNNVYKLDAKTGAIIASRNLHIPFLSADLDGCVDINPTVGITATGVIDPDTETLYLTSKTYADQTILNTAQGRPAGRYYLHALDVNDLSEKPNFPVNLEGIIARNNPLRMFNGGIHHQRPALLHTGQFIYAGFASHCVQYNFTGWIMGWDKTTGAVVEQYAMEGKGVDNTIKGGGVWMSGGGIASDDAGSIWYATGNGYASQLSNVPYKGFNPPTALEEAAVHMTINSDGSLNLVDFFMPWEKQALDGADKDLGTSPLEILPSQFSCGDVKRMGVVTGKSGKTYWLNLDNLGGYRNGADGLDDVIQVYQHPNSVYAGAGVYPLEGGYIYINVIQHPSAVFKFSCDNGVASFTKVAETPTSNAWILGVSHGTVTSLNNQPGTGLLWISDVQGLNLRIYNAVPKNGQLNMINSFNVPGVMKFTRPVFGDGIVYLGTNQGFFYGFGSPVNQPMNCTSPVDFGNVNLKTSSATKPITCTALIDVTVMGVGLDASTDFNITTLPQFPLQVAQGSSFTVQAKFTPSSVGLLSNDIIVNTTNSVAGYSSNTHARLTGTGQSAGPLLSLSPNTVTFQGVVTGDDPNGVSESLLLNNLGNAPLTIQSIKYSSTSSTGPFLTWNGTGDLVVGKFTLQKVPSSLAAGGGATINIVFDSSTSGTFSGFVTFVSDGGSQTVSIAGSSGPAPTALLEFQTPDGSGWVQYQSGTPFTFGNVTENNSRSLKFRITNKAPDGGVNLSLTVSKPPFGIPGIVRAVNQVDLAEGTSLAPGQNATAVLTCTVPKSQWNVNPYNGTAPWTLNTNDPKLGKQFIQFFCNAVAEQAPPLLKNSDQGQYRYIGCFKDNNPGRQLSTQLYGNNANTNAMCIAACAQGDYIFCGTQYHSECWAGNTIPNLKVDDSNCNYYCQGDINQVCGGNGDGTAAYISLFADYLQWDGNYTGTQPPPPTSGPSVNPGVDGYTSIGCYTEGNNVRALANYETTTKKTVAQCVDACKAGEYIYAGVEYGGECWCGDSFGDGAVQAPATDCSMTCNDNSTEYCGGSNRLNVYKLNPAAATTVPPTTTAAPTETIITTSPSSTPTGPVVNPGLAGYGSIGCYTEATNARALPNYVPTNSKTVEQCLNSCKAINYLYAGLEYGGECWCGNALSAGSVPAPARDCSMTCANNATEYCGGSNRLNVYKLGGGITTTTSAPPASTTAPSTGTVPGATSVSTTAVGTTSVGATSPGTTSPGTTSPSTTAPGTTLAGTTSAGTTSASTTSPSAAPTGPVAKKTVGNYVFQACWEEPPNDRTIIDKMYADDGMSLESCANFCYGYTYFGTEYGRECYCGNVLKAGSQKADNQGDCSFPCAGDHTELCGAALRLNLYKLNPGATTTSQAAPATSISTSTSTSRSTTQPGLADEATTSKSTTSAVIIATTAPISTLPATTLATSVVSQTITTSPSATPTGPIIYQGNKNYTYYGCLEEPSEGKLMDYQVYNNGTDMTPEVCLWHCDQYKYAGIEYGRECWCGDDLNLAGWPGATPGKNVTDSECDIVCPGNSTEYCGSGNRLQLYVRKQTPTKRWWL